MTTWDELTAAAAKEANEKLRRQNERLQQQRSNDTLGEIRDILKAMLDTMQDNAERYREQAAYNADIARDLFNTVSQKDEAITNLKSEVVNLRELLRIYQYELHNCD